MRDLDWNGISTGEWWVVVIALIMLLVGVIFGYAIRDREYRRRVGSGSTTIP